MDWLEFFASVIGALAWPATLVIGFFLIKRHLIDLFPFIDRLKYKDFELQFRKSVHELAIRSRAALPDRREQLPQPSKDRLYSLAEISPRSAILEAWLEIEAAAIDALERQEPDLALKAKGMAPLRLGELLVKRQLLSNDQLEIFHRLRELRNAAVHIREQSFQLDEVAEYIQLSTVLATEIRLRGLGV